MAFTEINREITWCGNIFILSTVDSGLLLVQRSVRVEVYSAAATAIPPTFTSANVISN